MHPSLRDRRRGMQVHAVPEAERAYDSSGRKLPWGYEYYTSDETVPATERGPFGRSQRRNRSGLSRSRSKTAENESVQDRQKAEQLAAEDAVFGSMRKINRDEGRQALGEVDTNAAAQPAAALRPQVEQEATEVLLYGFGKDLEWTALDHYERVSMGTILEDYARQATFQRFDISRTLPRAASQQNLSRVALQKRNTFAGGEHWIKVTFDSRMSAELACARSPHIIRGYLVYAEPYQGRGPGRDEPIPPTQAGAQINGPKLPINFSSDTLNASPNGSSTTATSATATGRSSSQTLNDSQTSTSSHTVVAETPQPQRSTSSSASTTALPSNPSTQGKPRSRLVEGATPASLQPASVALLPKQPKPSWTSWLGTGEVIGTAVPKMDDGRFDWNSASLYWRIFFWLDRILGTDFCGLRGD